MRVKSALSGGADVNELDLYGSPLHHAAAHGNIEVTTALIDAGANLEAEGEPARAHPLHVAAQNDQAHVAKLLVERGAQVNARDGEGRTPLIVAAANDKLGVAKMLMSHGADPTVADTVYGDTPLHHAAFWGDSDLGAF